MPAFVRGGDYPHAETVAVWPELAETGCFACHHDLNSPSWRQARGYAGRKPGESPWQSWLSPLIEDVSAEFGHDENPLSALAAQMAKPYPARAALADVAVETQQKLNQLGRSIDEQKLSHAQVASLMSRVAQHGSALAGQNWDGATQSYLALVALHQSLQDMSGTGAGVPDATGREVNRTLEEVLGQLAFPLDADSPQTFDGQAIEQLQDRFRAVQQSLSSGN